MDNLDYFDYVYYDDYDYYCYYDCYYVFILSYDYFIIIFHVASVIKKELRFRKRNMYRNRN